MTPKPRRAEVLPESHREGAGTAGVAAALVAGARIVQVPSTEAQNAFGRLLDQAAAGQDIAITSRGVERGVLMSAARYRELLRRAEPGVDDLAALEAEYDELYESMQRPDYNAVTDWALLASAAEIGRSASEAAREAAARHVVAFAPR